MWQEIVGSALVLAARIATEYGGSGGAAFARNVRELLEDAEFPTFRRAAREIGVEAKETLPRRRTARSVTP